jgi:hypothetical protein
VHKNWLKEIALKCYELNEFIIPDKLFSSAASGVAQANLEMKKKKAADAVQRGEDAAERLSAASARIKARGAVNAVSPTEAQVSGSENLISRFSAASKAGVDSANKTIGLIKTADASGGLMPSDYSTRDPLRRELNDVSPEFKARYDSRQARIDAVERKAREPIVTKKAKTAPNTEKPKEETKEERLKRIGSMSKEERLNFIKELNKPQQSAEDLINKSNRSMSDAEIEQKRSITTQQPRIKYSHLVSDNKTWGR